MKFSINYSEEAATLASQGLIEIDYFKCPDWPWMIAKARALRPVAVHFTITVGSGKFKRVDWEQVRRLRDETGTPYVNLHLEPEQREFPDIPVDTEEPAQQEQVVSYLIEKIKKVTRRFSPEQVILENLPYYGPGSKVLRPGVEPKLIRQILNETGCGLLLDISHARIAARSLGMDEREYISQLPVDRLCELHFTGLDWVDGRLRDHWPARDTDWPVLEWGLECIRQGKWGRPWMLAFEYGGVGDKYAQRSDPAVIASQAPHLYKLVQAI